MVIEARQRSISHVVVETDRTGADLTAFVGTDVVSVDQVSGETLHIHRSAPGGLSQRPDGIADQTVRLLSSLVAERVTDLAQQVATGLPSGSASTHVGDVLSAAVEGRVETLLVHDADEDGPLVDERIGDVPVGTRVVDAAIIAALRTDASIVVVPRLAIMEGPIAAVMRW